MKDHGGEGWQMCGRAKEWRLKDESVTFCSPLGDTLIRTGQSPGWTPSLGLMRNRQVTPSWVGMTGASEIVLHTGEAEARVLRCRLVSEICCRTLLPPD